MLQLAAEQSQIQEHYWRMEGELGSVIVQTLLKISNYEWSVTAP